VLLVLGYLLLAEMLCASGVVGLWRGLGCGYPDQGRTLAVYFWLYGAYAPPAVGLILGLVGMRWGWGVPMPGLCLVVGFYGHLQEPDAYDMKGLALFVGAWFGLWSALAFAAGRGLHLLGRFASRFARPS